MGSDRAVRILRGLVLCGWVGAFALGGGSARADQQEEVAAASFRRGAEAYAHHDYRGAALAFEAAHRIVPRGPTVYNAALAWAAANEEVRAADDFAAALASGLDSARASDADKRLADLEKKVSRLEVTAPAGAKVTIDGNDSLAPFARMHAAAGEHEVKVVLADGTADARRVSLTHGGVARVDFSPTGPAQKPAAAPAQAPPPGAAPEQAPASVTSDSGSTRRTLGWVALGGGVALSGVAVYLGLSGLQARDDFVAGGSIDSSLHDRAVALRTWTNVAWAGAAVVGATGVVLLLTSRHGGGEAGGTAVSFGPTGVQALGRF